MRKSLVLLPVLLVVAALLVASAPAEAGRRRVALGIWNPERASAIDVFDEFTQSMGGVKPAIWNVASVWGRPDNQAFPAVIAAQAKARGATLMVTWSPVKPPLATETGFYSQYKNIAAGRHDRYIRSWARQAKRFNRPILLRFAHEFNAAFFPWSVKWGKFYDPDTGERTTKNTNSPFQFRRAWIRIVKIFRGVRANKVKFVWTPAQETCQGCNPYKKWYPGNKWVDYVGYSTFNWGNFRQAGAFRNFEETIVQPMGKFKEFTRKPVIIAEVGTTHEDAPSGELDKPEWIINGYNAVYRKYPQVKAIVYQDVDFTGESHGHPNWGLAFSPTWSAIEAYRRVAAQPRFKGKVNWRGQIR